MKRDDQQLAAYLNGQMSPEEFAAFGERLERDESLARQLASMSLLEVHLRDQLRFEMEQSLADFAVPAVSRREKFIRWWSARLATLNRPLVLSLSIATVVMGIVVTALAFIAMPHFVPRSVPVHPAGEVVARLVNFDGPVWAIGQIGTTRGAFLRSNQSLDLRAGLATIEFNDGARITIEGPTTLQLLSASAARLNAGELLAHVPERGTGYQLHVGQLTVTDRGTRFAIAHQQGVANVEVFAGEVEIASTARRHESPLVLREGQAAKFSPRAELLEQGANRKPIDTRKAQLLAHRAQSSGQLQFLNSPPPSLTEGVLQSNQHAFLVLERENVLLSRPTTALVPQGTSGGKAKLAAGTLPNGERVDVYLVHMDIEEATLTDPSQKITCRGTIIFERPVVGLFTTDQRLAATDAEFGAPQTTYETDADRSISRGLELDNLDQISVSADAHTVSFVGVLGLPKTDQFRIFVQAAEP